MTRLVHLPRCEVQQGRYGFTIMMEIDQLGKSSAFQGKRDIGGSKIGGIGFMEKGCANLSVYNTISTASELTRSKVQLMKGKNRLGDEERDQKRQ